MVKIVYNNSIRNTLKKLQERLEPLQEAMFDDGLELYSDDLRDCIDQIEMILRMLEREKESNN